MTVYLAGAGDKKASDAVLYRGILLVTVFYGCWSIIIFAGKKDGMHVYLTVYNPHAYNKRIDRERLYIYNNKESH